MSNLQKLSTGDYVALLTPEGTTDLYATIAYTRDFFHVTNTTNGLSLRLDLETGRVLTLEDIPGNDGTVITSSHEAFPASYEEKVAYDRKKYEQDCDKLQKDAKKIAKLGKELSKLAQDAEDIGLAEFSGNYTAIQEKIKEKKAELVSLTASL